MASQDKVPLTPTKILSPVLRNIQDLISQHPELKGSLSITFELVTIAEDRSAKHFQEHENTISEIRIENFQLKSVIEKHEQTKKASVELATKAQKMLGTLDEERAGFREARGKWDVEKSEAEEAYQELEFQYMELEKKKLAADKGIKELTKEKADTERRLAQSETEKSSFRTNADTYFKWWQDETIETGKLKSEKSTMGKEIEQLKRNNKSAETRASLLAEAYEKAERLLHEKVTWGAERDELRKENAELKAHEASAINFFTTTYGNQVQLAVSTPAATQKRSFNTDDNAEFLDMKKPRTSMIANDGVIIKQEFDLTVFKEHPHHWAPEGYHYRSEVSAANPI